MSVHPKCGKTIPGGNSGGHCARCCESFRGDAAFDKHLIRHRENGTTTRMECQHPSTATTPTGKPLDYWQDDKGIWHLGARGTGAWWGATND